MQIFIRILLQVTETRSIFQINDIKQNAILCNLLSSGWFLQVQLHKYYRHQPVVGWNCSSRLSNIVAVCVLSVLWFVCWVFTSMFTSHMASWPHLNYLKISKTTTQLWSSYQIFPNAYNRLLFRPLLIACMILWYIMVWILYRGNFAVFCHSIKF